MGYIGVILNTIQFFKNSLLRIAEPSIDPPGRYYQETKDLHYYPSLLLLYAAGISSIKTQKFEFLASIFKLKTTERKSENSVKFFLIQKTNSWLIQPSIMNQILNQNYKTPLSTYVNGILRPYFKDIILNDQDFNDIYDIFEYMLCLHFLHYTGYSGAPFGQFKWRSLSGYRTNGTIIPRLLFRRGDTKRQLVTYKGWNVWR